jgi:predicted RNase H-like HicB family nuclease
MQLTLETEQEADGRWLAEVPEIPGALAYGATRAAAMAAAEALALHALAERLEAGEATPMPIQLLFAAE